MGSVPEFLIAVTASLLASVTVFLTANLTGQAASLIEDFYRALRIKSVKFDDAIAHEDIFSALAADFATVGELSLDKYTSSTNTRARVDGFLAAAKSFLEPDPAMDALAPEAPAAGQRAEARSDEELATSEESWNQLARLRRDIEINLRERAAAAGLDGHTREPMSRTLDRLSRAGLIDERATSDIAYFYRVASAAIHGEDIPPDHAAEAMWVGRRGLEALGGAPNNGIEQNARS